MGRRDSECSLFMGLLRFFNQNFGIKYLFCLNILKCDLILYRMIRLIIPKMAVFKEVEHIYFNDLKLKSKTFNNLIFVLK